MTADEDVKKYNERQKKAAEAPVQVDEVDSCLARTRVGLTLEDDPDGLRFLLAFSFQYRNATLKRPAARLASAAPAVSLSCADAGCETASKDNFTNSCTNGS